MAFASIPTKYKGIQFRSRLEAKWAAFFDLLDWDWTYEPFDLHGWIPDFALNFKKPVLVEVKPILTKADFRSYRREFTRAKTDLEVLLVGTQLFQKQQPSSKVVVGQLLDRVTKRWHSAILFTCRECSEYSFYSAGGTERCRNCGHLDKEHKRSHLDFITAADHVSYRLDRRIKDHWVRASNRVQWNRRS